MLWRMQSRVLLVWPTVKRELILANTNDVAVGQRVPDLIHKFGSIHRDPIHTALVVDNVLCPFTPEQGVVT